LEESNNTAPVANETPVESYSSQGAEAAPVDQTQNIGVQEIIVGSEITDKDRDILYERLGRPKDHEGYDLSGIVPETYNQGVVDEFKKKAHETGMSAEGVRKMAEWYKELEIKQRATARFPSLNDVV
jgi:hypothetical protein